MWNVNDILLGAGKGKTKNQDQKQERNEKDISRREQANTFQLKTSWRKERTIQPFQDDEKKWWTRTFREVDKSASVASCTGLRKATGEGLGTVSAQKNGRQSRARTGGARENGPYGIFCCEDNRKVDTRTIHGGSGGRWGVLNSLIAGDTTGGRQERVRGTNAPEIVWCVPAKWDTRRARRREAQRN